MRRTQIYLDEAQTARLDARASASGRTRSELIRDAIRDYLADADGAQAEIARQQRRCLLAAFGTEPELGESVAELRRADRRRADDLDRQWRSAR